MNVICHKPGKHLSDVCKICENKCLIKMEFKEDFNLSMQYSRVKAFTGCGHVKQGNSFGQEK